MRPVAEVIELIVPVPIPPLLGVEAVGEFDDLPVAVIESVEDQNLGAAGDRGARHLVVAQGAA